MAAHEPNVYRTSHQLMCEMLSGILRHAVQAGPDAADGIGSIPARTVATLYMLLMGHPVDRRGRCRSCRRPGAVFGGRWRRCRIHGEARVWLHQPAEFVASQLARELGLVEPQLGAETTHEEPTDAADPPTPTTSQSPAVPPSAHLPGGFPGAGRPDPDHGGAGEPTPTRTRPRRVPPDDPVTPHKAMPLVLTAGPTWQP